MKPSRFTKDRLSDVAGAESRGEEGADMPAHDGVASGDPDPDAARDRDDRRPGSSRTPL